MRPLPRVAAVAATATLLAATAAGAAHASSPAPRPDRMTFVRTVALDVAAGVADQRGSSRKVSTVRSAFAAEKAMWAEVGGALPVTLGGLVDRNEDGLDDDGQVTLTMFANRAVIDLRTGTVRDGGFVLKDKRAVLKESALNLDIELRWLARSIGTDTWSMFAINAFRADAAPGVTVTSDRDGNADDLDDDGRLTLLKGGKAVTLTIGNTLKEKGKVSYGPTWSTPAPKRTHHRADAAFVRAAEHAGAQASVAQFSKILMAESATSLTSARDMKVLRAAIATAKADGVTGLTVTGLVDANRDGVDDDATITVSLNKGRDVFTLKLAAEAGDPPVVTDVKG